MEMPGQRRGQMLVPLTLIAGIARFQPSDLIAEELHILQFLSQPSRVVAEFF